MKKPLRLFSLNIERAKHYDRWIPFVKKSVFDVICLQEVFQSDLILFEKEFGARFIFAPMGNITRDDNNQQDIIGVAIGSLIPFEKQHEQYYTEPFNPEGLFGDHNTFKVCPRVLLGATCLKDGSSFNIKTTHFTWTSNSESNVDQERDLKKLLELLKQQDDFILCGDMNAPRGKATFDTIAKKYTDHIPTHYLSSLDMRLRSSPFVGDSNLMVDALFSTSHYRFENVELVSGLSDHMGIVADIYKK